MICKCAPDAASQVGGSGAALSRRRRRPRPSFDALIEAFKCCLPEACTLIPALTPTLAPTWAPSLAPPLAPTLISTLARARARARARTRTRTLTRTLIRTLTPTQVPARCTSWPDAPSGGGGGGGVGFATGLSLSSGSSDSFESDALSDVSGKVRSFQVGYYRHVIGMHYLLCLYCAYTVHPCTCTSLGQGIRWGDVHVLSRTKHVLPPESTHMQCTRLGKVPTRCRAPSWASSSPLPPPLHLHQ